MKQYIIYGLGVVMIIAGIFVSGWLGWVLVGVGVILTYVANAVGSAEAVGETDKTILCLLMLASTADGNASDKESAYVQEYIKRRGLSNKQVKIALKDIKDPSKWKYSANDETKMRIIDEVVGLIKSDNVVTETEKKFLTQVAEILNVDSAKALAKL